MNTYFQQAKTYVIEHKKEFTIGVSVALAIIIIFLGLALYSYNTKPPEIEFEPANACDLLTPDEAKSLLGDAAINGVNNTPVQQKNVTVSKCSYSDGLADTSNAVVAALAVRSGINDAGIEKNKADFVTAKPSAGFEDVEGVGDSAYYTVDNGQLNILKASTWLIVSYGSATAPQDNSLEDTIELAKLIIN